MAVESKVPGCAGLSLYGQTQKHRQNLPVNAHRNLWIRCLRFLYMEKRLDQAALILNNNVLFFYQQHGWHIKAILTDDRKRILRGGVVEILCRCRRISEGLNQMAQGLQSQTPS